MKRNINKLDFKIKDLGSLKVNTENIKMLVTDWENIFVMHISDKGLTSRILKEFLEFNNKKRKSEQNLNRHSQKKTYSKHM